MPGPAWSASLQRFADGLSVVNREIDYEVPITWLLAVLAVGRFQDRPGGLSIRDLSDILGFSYSTTAELVKKLAPPGHRFAYGLGLLEYRDDPTDERRKLLSLTGTKGKALLRRIDALLSH